LLASGLLAKPVTTCLKRSPFWRSRTLPETLVLLEKKLSQLFVIVCFVKAGDGPVSGGVVVFLPELPHAASVSAATSRSTSPLTTGKPRPPAASALPARRSARTGGRARRAAFARGCAP